ncbi:Cullin-5 [Triplophysa tibetana]|uniref:Cullin-5 n=2 Tax=Cypriniformes TaxID=7952 RepID=A0A5A9MYB8_9TELE|nr:Cullin-5 [Triplophysa tibetana]
MGSNCEKKIDRCSSDPCANGYHFRQRSYKELEAGILITKGSSQACLANEIVNVAVVLEEQIIQNDLEDVANAFATFMDFLYGLYIDYPKRLKGQVDAGWSGSLGVTAFLRAASGTEVQPTAQTHHRASATSNRADSSDRTSGTAASGITGLGTTSEVTMMTGGSGLATILQTGSVQAAILRTGSGLAAIVGDSLKPEAVIEVKKAADAGKEIAFVLDGSGSIRTDDFEKAKDFIYNVMLNVWKTCFDCDFAVVQYGYDILTELSLRDNEDGARALEKVKEIKQLGRFTKTASAIHHVLTNIFVPESGSKNNSRKMIIVLSDGEILGDEMNLTDVLNMPQMEGITRFAIGCDFAVVQYGRDIRTELSHGDSEDRARALNKVKEIQQLGSFTKTASAIHHVLTNIFVPENGSKNYSRKMIIVLSDGEILGDPMNLTDVLNMPQMNGITRFAIGVGDDLKPAAVQEMKEIADTNKFFHVSNYAALVNILSQLCDFAVVQYGYDILTELSLRDNEDGARALEKVKEIKQLGRFTKTASAIHHVLTNIFVPESGSKNNSRKMIIVLSDGEILGDEMNLTDVLNMPQMEGITRFAIGVGDDLKPAAVQEMKEIADTNNFFHVSNYAALVNILSQLQQSITGIEGYSVASAHLPSKTLYISGAPRYNLTGGVFIFEGSEKYVLQGEQVGSYFGSVICTLDIDMNGYTDHLLVGAPHFHQYGEEGKVLVYKLNQQERFESVDNLERTVVHPFARFGAAIASIGDIDGNSHGDIAVGAPFETDASGSIYIYNGFKDGLRFSQNKGSLQFEDKWDLMRPIVLKLLRQESVTKQQWFDLFSDVHAVCLWDDKGPAKIHQALKEDILDFIKQAQARVLSHQDDTALLKAYIVEWRKFFTQCDILPKPFCQLEITLMGKQGSNKKSNVEDSIVRKLMLDTWNESIFSNIKNRLQDSAMKLVHAERLGEAFDSQLVIGVRESYVNLCSNPDDKLQIYRDNFEKAYLDSTERFYRTQAPSYLQQNGVQNYMKYADAKLREEEKRALRYLETRRECNSVQALMECCVNALVTSFKETILAECPGMIKRNETDKLHLMFSLMDKVPSGIEPMLKDLEDHIISAGLADMVAAAETITTDSEKYVEQLLTLFNRFSKLVKEAFQDDPRFLTARDKAYKAVVNDATIFKLELPLKQKGVGLKTQPESKCPELLANYCDMLLRKTPLSKKLTSEEIELKLKEVLLVLKYVQNKDVFMRYHKAHLTRRLILDISADSEIEENMVEWLREVGMPADYVNKLARMFQDIKVSEDLNQVFKEMHKHNRLALPADSVNIKILNAGAWSRSSEKVFVSLPTELEDLIPEVEDFYKKNHSGRKLHWHHLMSNGIITFKNEVGQYDLEVTTFQLAVLFAWNQRPREKISFENLKLATELPDAELRRTLWSLVAFPKLKRQVLSYEPLVNSPKDFTDSTLFFVNQEFSLIKNSKVQKRGKINLIGRLQLTTERMREEENEGIVQLRILRTQEAIIQIMKMRKKITNAQLQTELVEILKNMFLPQKKMIKEQIEWLIEHKYIKRDETDINTFIYMA